MDVLDHLLHGPTPLDDAHADVKTWFDRLEACPFETPIDRALWAGFEADRLGFAFVGGYRAALIRLFGWGAETTSSSGAEAPSPSARLCLAVTESGGGHPRAMTTALIEEAGALRVRGEKTFATLASAATEILVVATRGAGTDGKNQLALVRVRADAPGVVIEDRTPTPFAPEVPHARVKLDVEVTARDVLPGDGYDVYVKPFRTIEDTHVLAATLGHVIRVARASGFDGAAIEGAVALILGLRAVAGMAPVDPKAHVALAGCFTAGRKLLADHDKEWAKAAPSTRERWRRDEPLLLVAEAARQARTKAAWSRLGR